MPKRTESAFTYVPRSVEEFARIADIEGALATVAKTSGLAALAGASLGLSACVIVAIAGTINLWTRSREAKTQAGRDAILHELFAEYKRQCAATTAIAESRGLRLAEFGDDPSVFVTVLNRAIEIEGENTRTEIQELRETLGPWMQQYMDWLAVYLRTELKGFNHTIDEVCDELQQVAGQFETAFGVLEFQRGEIEKCRAELGRVLAETTEFGRKLDFLCEGRRPCGFRLTLPDPSDENKRFLFSQRTYDLFGRVEELERLRGFLDHQDGFRFMIVTGPGGVGKSRLLWEICWASRFDGWDAGFVYQLSEKKVDWHDWQPEKDTLLVVDYILARNADEWVSFIRQLADSKSKKKIRIVIADRPADTDTWHELFYAVWPYVASSCASTIQGDGGDLPLVAPFPVHGLGLDDLTGLFRTMLKRTGIDPSDAAVHYQNKIDPTGRPLFAMMAAEAFASEESPVIQGEWDTKKIVGFVLNGLYAQWKRSKIDQSHLDLLALATMTGGLLLKEHAYNELRNELPGSGLPRYEDLKDPQFRILASYSAKWDSDERSLPALEPGMLGEAFVLETLRGRELVSTNQDARKKIARKMMIVSEGGCSVRRSNVMGVGGEEAATWVIDHKGFRKLARHAVQDFGLESVELLRGVKHLDLSGLDLTDLACVEGMSSLESLYADGTRIQDLTPLSGLSNLKRLSLNNTSVSDLEPLRQVTQLENLSLNNTQVSKLTPIEELTKLTTLWLNNTKISDISPLEGLVELEVVQLNSTQVSNIDPLTNLKNLTKLWLNSTAVSDISPVEGHDRLEVLELNGTSVSELGPIKGLENLNTLWLNGTNVSDISPLSHSTRISSLDIDRTPVSDISALTNLKGLTSLHLHQTQVKDLTPLAQLENLSLLSLGGSQVSDISPLEALTNLKTLWLNDTYLKDISSLAGLSKLESLQLNNTQVSDISPLAGLTRLKSLMLNSERVKDVSPLAGLKSLEMLQLNGSRVSKLAPLKGLTSLRMLWLNDTKVSDLSSLAGLSNLEILQLSSTSVTKLSPLNGLTNLRTLWLNDTKVLDISPLAGLTKLEDLQLARTNVLFLEPVSKLTELVSLSLHQTTVSYIAPLANLHKLKSLSIGQTRVSDIKYLIGLTNLTHLWMSNTKVSDLSPLTGLVQLESLNLYRVSVSDLSPLTGLTNLKTLTLDADSVIDTSVLDHLQSLNIELVRAQRKLQPG